MLDINNQQFKKLKIALDLFLKEKKLYLDNAPMKSSMPSYNHYNKIPKLQYTMLKSGLVKNADEFLERFLIEPLIFHYNMGCEGLDPKKIDTYTDFVGWLHNNKKTEELYNYLSLKFSGNNPDKKFLEYSLGLFSANYPSKLIEIIKSSRVIKMIYPDKEMLKSVFRTIDIKDISLVLESLKDNGELKTLSSKKFLSEILGQSIGYEKLETFEKYFRTRKLTEELTKGIVSMDVHVIKIDLSKKALAKYVLHKHPTLKVDSGMTAGEVFLGLEKLVENISKDSNKKDLLNIHNIYKAGGGESMTLFLAIKDNKYSQVFYEKVIDRAIDDFYEKYAIFKNTYSSKLDIEEIFSHAISSYEKGELGSIFKGMVNNQIESIKLPKSLKI